ncbi:helix-turn-helix domain-containing protein [Sediminibacillus massiliensis]|uniref:helix-turn-helix domain-containing protein n=1 Tax=Sediminibacillus massiliensis TaxID=1926277 RepID=UPI0015C3A8D8|nr:helix-turn-helix domain-containing protein [Sediminibacillus massiliensis]
MGHLGQIIKELREYRDLSQLELCEDICTQSFISRLEKGEVSPSAQVLYRIALRLGVDINYFFEFANNCRKDYAREFCEEIRKLIIHSSFQEAQDLLLAETNNPRFKSMDMQKFMLWNKGICDYYVNQEFHRSIRTLNHALKITETALTILTVRDIEIMNSIANIYNEERDIDNAVAWYQCAIQYWKRTPSFQKDNLYYRILYNYAVVLSRKEDYQQALNLCNKGIRACLENHNLYLLGEFLYEKGLNLSYLGEKTNSQKYMKQALYLSEIQEKVSYVTFINGRMEKL